MSNKCESCFEIQETVNCDDFVECAHEAIRSSDAAIHKLSKRFSTIDLKVEDINKKINDIQENLTKLKSDAINLDRRVNTAENSIVDLQSDVAKIKNDLTIVNSNLSALDKRLLDSENNIGQINIILVELENRITLSENKISDIKERIKSLETLVDTKANKGKPFVETLVPSNQQLKLKPDGACYYFKDEFERVTLNFSFRAENSDNILYGNDVIFTKVESFYCPPTTVTFPITASSLYPHSKQYPATASIYPDGTVRFNIYNEKSCLINGTVSYLSK